MILRPFLVLGAMPIGYATAGALSLAAAVGKMLGRPAGEPDRAGDGASTTAEHDQDAPLAAAAAKRDTT